MKLSFHENRNVSSSLAGLAAIVAIFVPSVIFWENKWNLAQWLPASGETVIHQHQYWRLLTGILVHSDFKHFLSNAVPLAFFGSLLYGYFGFGIFPCWMLALGCLIHLISIGTYPPEATLVGASGVVYCMAGFWLTLFVLIERRYSIPNRLMRSIGFFLIVFVPSTFEPTVSYRAHAIGFGCGILSATSTLLKIAIKSGKRRSLELEEAVCMMQDAEDRKCYQAARHPESWVLHQNFCLIASKPEHIPYIALCINFVWQSSLHSGIISTYGRESGSAGADTGSRSAEKNFGEAAF